VGGFDGIDRGSVHGDNEGFRMCRNNLVKSGERHEPEHTPRILSRCIVEDLLRAQSSNWRLPAHTTIEKVAEDHGIRRQHGPAAGFDIQDPDPYPPMPIGGALHSSMTGSIRMKPIP
jgi:hypothetical protein